MWIKKDADEVSAFRRYEAALNPPKAE